MKTELSNTTKRIFAAIVLTIILMVILFWGYKAFIGYLFIIGLVLIDECVVNIFKQRRTTPTYFVNVLVYIFLFYFFLVIKDASKCYNSILCISMVINLLSIFYLFFTPQDNLSILNWLKKSKIFWGLYFYINISLFVSLIFLGRESWIYHLILLLLICFGMDTGGWFFGKKFGKRKLWPSVSPNKTIEGLLGGVFLSGVLAGAYYIRFFNDYSLIIAILFPFLGALSHIGDLFQSKIKRQCGVKNSSSLIPGHGGVYDRLDSVIFLVPFYLTLMFYYQIF